MRLAKSSLEGIGNGTSIPCFIFIFGSGRIIAASQGAFDTEPLLLDWQSLIHPDAVPAAGRIKTEWLAGA